MHLQCVLKSAAIVGVSAVPVDVEVAVSAGLPGITIVGMPDAAVRESQERVRAALRACGFSMPRNKVVINLAPGSLRKAGAGFDLPIAAAILGATGQVDRGRLDSCLWAGELSLEGRVRPVKGTLALASCARELGLRLAVASGSSDSAALEGLVQYGLRSLSDLRKSDLSPLDFERREPEIASIDFGEIYDHEAAKRAMQVAAAGGHGILLTGPPGSGKTMLAKALASILPPLGEEERLRAAVVHSVAGEPVGSILAGARPFRAVHHTASAAGLVGGGNPIRPGEISLAHEGVLFLDELPEFSPSVLQALRQPMERGSITITRVDGSVEMPSRFMMVAAANPCPCGYFGDPDRSCSCAPSQVARYQNRIGGPLVDRIDMHVDVWRCDPKTIIRPDGVRGADSASLSCGVRAAREFAQWRRDAKGDDDSLATPALLSRCRLGGEEERLLETACRARGLSGRGIARILSIARTIADMAQEERVGEEHLVEAIGFRMRKEA